MGVLSKVVANSFQEVGLADERNKLLQHRSALGIGDAVEVDLHVVEVVDLSDDWVG